MGNVPKGFHDPRYRSVIDRLVAERRRLGLSQADVAGRLGGIQRFVSRYETGERRLDFIELHDVAMALGVDPVELMEEVGRAATMAADE